MVSEKDVELMWPDWTSSNSYKELDPHEKQPTEPGAKLDSGKPAVFRGLFDYFPNALLEVAKVSTKGAEKYSWKGWESVQDGINRYSDALGRHFLEPSSTGSYIDGDTGMYHPAQVAWNALAVLELFLKERKE